MYFKIIDFTLQSFWLERISCHKKHNFRRLKIKYSADVKLKSPLILTNTSPSHNVDCTIVKTSLPNKLLARKSKEAFIFQHHRHINGTFDQHLACQQAKHPLAANLDLPSPNIWTWFFQCLSSLSNHSKTQQSHEKESIPYLNTLKSNPNLQI